MKKCLDCKAEFVTNTEVVFHTCENVTDVCEHEEMCSSTSDHYALLQWEDSAMDAYLERVREEKHND